MFWATDVVETKTLGPLRGGDQRRGSQRDEEVPEPELTLRGCRSSHDAPFYQRPRRLY